MKNLKVKKSILLVILFVLVIGVASNVLATGTTNSPIQIPTINTSTNVATNTTTNIVANTVANTTVQNVNTSTYTNTNLPQT